MYYTCGFFLCPWRWHEWKIGIAVRPLNKRLENTKTNLQKGMGTGNLARKKTTKFYAGRVFQFRIFNPKTTIK